MAAVWTAEQILALAPDPASAKNGRGLASPAKWPSLGKSARAVWGECKGSGAEPYKVRIDLGEPAFKCSCPSRKFPCKHGIGLFLLFAEKPAALTEGEPPGWVKEWLDSREGRAAKQADRAEAAATREADPVAQAKREAARGKRIEDGLEELRLWLRDLVRGGLAHAQGEPVGFWETMARRMIDAQAPGLGRLIQDLALVGASGAGWQDRMLSGLARLQLLASAHARLDTLDDALRSDVRAWLGVPLRKEEVLAAQPVVSDSWTVAAQSVTLQEDGLRSLKAWLVGERTGRIATILSFAHRGGSFDASFAPGITQEMNLVFYPSARPERALLKERRSEARPAAGAPRGHVAARDALAEYAAALALLPWAPRHAATLHAFSPRLQANRLWLADSEGDALPARAPGRLQWEILAAAGGGRLDLFGEWDGHSFRPLAAWDGARHEQFS